METSAAPTEVTVLLEQVRAGNEDAQIRLVHLLYEELRRLAVSLMRQERPDHTLQPTALLHEALLKLLGQDVLTRAPDRRYVFAAATRAMREVLVDHARQRGTRKRGDSLRKHPLDDVLDYLERRDVNVLAMHEALSDLARLHERQSQVVTLRFLGNFTVQEVAQMLDVSISTVETDFRFARAWLRRQLGESLP